MRVSKTLWPTVALFLSLGSPAFSGPPAGVTLIRVPNGGVQAQTQVDEAGVLHMIYLEGDPGNSAIYYVRSTDGGDSFGKALRVDSAGAGAMAVGTVRGAHMALGKNARVHVAWMRGGDRFLYSRLNDEKTAFENPKNLLKNNPGLDGGGSVAADPEGRVYGVWHSGGEDEAGRRVWIAISSDEGKTFAPEKAAWAKATGACGCCGMRAYAGGPGKLAILYRSATELIHRDMFLLQSLDGGNTFGGWNVDPMESGTCLMSTAFMGPGYSLTTGGRSVFMAWENMGKIHGAALEPATKRILYDVEPRDLGAKAKHPVYVDGGSGGSLMAWTEGTGWNQGGAVAWQVFEKGDIATPIRGRREGVPVWGSVAAFPRPDGGFGIVY